MIKKKLNMLALILIISNSYAINKLEIKRLPGKVINTLIHTKQEAVSSARSVGYLATDPAICEFTTGSDFNSENFGNAFTHDSSITSIMTLNSYLFPQITTQILKDIKHIDLQEKTRVSANVRLQRQANLIKREGPDIVVLQEVWGNCNKMNMVKALRNVYPYYYYKKINYANRSAQLLNELFRFKKSINNPLGTKDGLLIMSKKPILSAYSITFSQKVGDEKNAEKGALIVTFNNNGKNLTVIDTHLQSGRDHESVATRQGQLNEIGRALRNYGLTNNSIVLAGDTNEPITYNNQMLNMLVTRGTYLQNALNAGAGLPENYISDNLSMFMATHMPEPVDYILAVNEQGRDEKACIKTVDIGDGVCTNVNNAVFLSDNIKSYLMQYAQPYGQYHANHYLPYKYRTVRDSGQMLDWMLSTNNISFNDVKVLRAEFLGSDTTETLPFNDNISDHAGVVYSINIGAR